MAEDSETGCVKKANHLSQGGQCAWCRQRGRRCVVLRMLCPMFEPVHVAMLRTQMADVRYGTFEIIYQYPAMSALDRAVMVVEMRPI